MLGCAPDHPGMREVGEKLQVRARELGLTDAEVARRLGLAQGRYSNYVNGAREPDLATLARICRELAITPDELLGFRDIAVSDAAGTRARIDALLNGFGQQQLDLAYGLLTVVAHERRTEPSPPKLRKAPSTRKPRPVTT